MITEGKNSKFWFMCAKFNPVNKLFLCLRCKIKLNTLPIFLAFSPKNMEIWKTNKYVKNKYYVLF